MKVLLLVCVAGFMHAARSFTEAGMAPGYGTTLAFGYVLVTAYLAGRIFSDVHLPRLTGYLAIGILSGPHGLDLLTAPMLRNLGLVNGVAISLIALTAGLELELRALRPLARVVTWISAVAVVGTALLLATACIIMRGWFDFMTGMPFPQVVAVALILGVIMAAQSPAVVVALRDETGADGPVARTVLAVVVLADLLVIVLFAMSSGAAKAVFGAEGVLAQTMAKLAWELLGSVVTGALLGAVLTLYLRHVKSGAALFVLATAVIAAEVGARVELDPLLVALTAGLLVRNVTTAHGALTEAVTPSVLPVYAIFFAVAGANLRLDALGVLALPLAVLFLVRLFGLIGGTRLAQWIASAPADVGRFAGWGLVPQAGLALALAVLFAEIFPELGHEAASLTVGLVAVNEVVGPVLFRSAIVRSGESGRRRA